MIKPSKKWEKKTFDFPWFKFLYISIYILMNEAKKKMETLFYVTWQSWDRVVCDNSRGPWRWLPAPISGMTHLPVMRSGGCAQVASGSAILSRMCVWCARALAPPTDILVFLQRLSQHFRSCCCFLSFLLLPVYVVFFFSFTSKPSFAFAPPLLFLRCI